jgi:hypothetical protein
MHSEELSNLYSCPNNIMQIKSSRVRQVGHATCMGEERKVYSVLVVKP